MVSTLFQMKTRLLLLSLLAISGSSFAAPGPETAESLNWGLSPQITNISGRETICLDGEWKTIVDQYENGYYDYRLKPMSDERTFFADDSYHKDPTRLVEYDFDTDLTLRVPGDWNTQREKLYYYEGTIWYKKTFDIVPKAGKRYFAYFGAVNYEAIVAVNGKVCAKHTGGYTPFNFEITGLLHPGTNTIIVKADNKRRPEGVPTVNSDWWNYGGITRSVYIVETPSTFVREYNVQLKKGTENTVEGWVKLDGASEAQKVKVTIPQAGLYAEVSTDAEGYAPFEMTLKKKKDKLQLWSPENPKLYDVQLSTDNETISDRIGLRTIEARGNELYLNGKKIFLSGICIHEEEPREPGGRAWSEEHARTLLGWCKEMNCNFVRLAHYPHNEAMVRTAEELGIMVWDEIPVYWTIHWTDPQTYANAEGQLVDMITRDRNRANVIIWSVSNETPRGDDRLRFLSNLIDKAHELDPTRLVSSAMEKEYINPEGTHATCSDALASKVDLMSFNQYIGWYDGDKDKCDKVYWTFDIQKPVIISEWGGGAKFGYHGDSSVRFTEEYQAELYKANVKMLDRMPGLAGSTPWILKDFRSPRRQLKGLQDDYNRKGVISEKGEKKQAFYILKDWYATKNQ